MSILTTENNEPVLFLSESEFIDEFCPIQHDDSFEPLAGCLFSTYGKDMEFIKDLISSGWGLHIWSYLDIGEASPIIEAGYKEYFCFGYFISDNAFPSDLRISVQDHLFKDGKPKTAHILKNNNRATDRYRWIEKLNYRFKHKLAEVFFK